MALLVLLSQKMTGINSRRMPSSLHAHLRRRCPSLRLGQSQFRGNQLEREKKHAFKDTIRRCPTLKELQEEKYLFPDSDLSGMLDDLLEKGVIQLPNLKRPEDVRRTVDPKYCCHHRMVGHPLEKCVTLKEQIMRFIEDGMIVLDLDGVIKTNHISC